MPAANTQLAKWLDPLGLLCELGDIKRAGVAWGEQSRLASLSGLWRCLTPGACHGSCRHHGGSGSSIRKEQAKTGREGFLRCLTRRFSRRLRHPLTSSVGI